MKYKIETKKFYIIIIRKSKEKLSHFIKKLNVLSLYSDSWKKITDNFFVFNKFQMIFSCLK